MRMTENLFELHQKWCLFLQLATEKNAIFGAAQTNFWPFLFWQGFSMIFILLDFMYVLVEFTRAAPLISTVPT